MLSFGEVKRDNGVLQVAGATASSERFRYLVNESVQRLLLRGDFPGTLVPIFVCASNGCVTWPRYVGQIRSLYTCQRQIDVKGVWYQFLDRRCWAGWCGMPLTVPAIYTGPASYYPSPAVNQGRYPLHKDIQGDGRYVRLYHRCQQDLGKKVTIFGVDNGNQPLMHRNDEGNWEDGLQLTLAAPYVQSTIFVRRIDRVVKEETQCQVLAYAVNSTDSDVLEDLAIWDGSEESPARLRQNVFLGCGCNGSETLGVTALVKLAYIPVRNDEDWVGIGNMAAVKSLIQAVILEEGGNDVAAEAKIQKAVTELNHQAQNEMPDNELPIDVQPLSGVCVGSYRVF